MRRLALDIGTVRIGIAVSDPLGLLASPHSVLERTTVGEDLSHLAEIVSRFEVGEVIIGLPVRTTGEEGPEAEATREFAKRLRAMCGIPVTLVDERMTTQQANRVLIDADLSRRRRKRTVDKVAAAILLQSYLDSLGGGAAR